MYTFKQESGTGQIVKQIKFNDKKYRMNRVQ